MYYYSNFIYIDNDFDIFIDCKVIPAIGLVNIHHHTIIDYFPVIRTSKIYFLSNFEMDNTFSCNLCNE